MAASISGDHPLRDLFNCLVEKAMAGQAGLREPQVCRYLAGVLVDFTHRDHLYQVRDAQGRRLDQVAHMLLESDLALNATSFDRERAVHKHIGDFTLFWTGVYPEMLRSLRQSAAPDHLLDYVAVGRRSYRIASSFNLGRYAEEAPTLEKLARRFEDYAAALGGLRREMDALSTPLMRRFRDMLA